MSDNYNDLNKDTSNIVADGTLKKTDLAQVAMTVESDIDKLYSEHKINKLKSQIETNVETEDTKGILTTNVEKTEGVQTGLNNDKDTIQTGNNKNSIQTGTSDDTEVDDSFIDTYQDEYTGTAFDNTEKKKKNTKIKTKTDQEDNKKSGIKTGVNSEGKKKEKSKNEQIQTKIDKEEKGLKRRGKATKAGLFGTRVFKYGVKKSKQIATAATGEVGETFTSSLSDTTKRTVGRVTETTTRPIRRKIRQGISKAFAKMAKAVVGLLSKLITALAELLGISVPVFLVILIVLIILVVLLSLLSGQNMVFGSVATDETLTSYVDYMDTKEEEISTTVDWKAVCSVIYALDFNVQYDEAEQYLLNQFNSANLYLSGQDIDNFTDWISSNTAVVTTFYEMKGETENTTLDEEDIELIEECYNEKDFMKLIDEKRGSSVNTGSTTGSSGSGTLSEKLSYPTSYHSISAGYPNYSNGSYHGGVDFPAPTGTDVCAAADGTVIVAKELTDSYGHYLIIDHGNGVSTLYAHNSKLLVGVGDTVTRGQVIAKSGSTGNSTGPHCHFEVRINGKRVNPLSYLEE